MVLQVNNFKAIRITSISGIAKVLVDARDVGATIYLGHTEEELMQAAVNGVAANAINGTRITNANSPSAVDWHGELWARADQDGRFADFRVQQS